MLFRKKSKAAAAPAPVAMAFGPDGEPDMRGLGRVLWQKKARILGFTLFAAAAAFLVVNSITPRYRSESRLLARVARECVFARGCRQERRRSQHMVDPEAVTSQIQIVLSRDLAREVIKKENLANNPEFDPVAGGLRC